MRVSLSGAPLMVVVVQQLLMEMAIVSMEISILISDVLVLVWLLMFVKHHSRTYHRAKKTPPLWRCFDIHKILCNYSLGMFLLRKGARFSFLSAYGFPVLRTVIRIGIPPKLNVSRKLLVK